MQYSVNLALTRIAAISLAVFLNVTCLKSSVQSFIFGNNFKKPFAQSPKTFSGKEAALVRSIFFKYAWKFLVWASAYVEASRSVTFTFGRFMFCINASLRLDVKKYTSLFLIEIIVSLNS